MLYVPQMIAFSGLALTSRGAAVQLPKSVSALAAYALVRTKTENEHSLLTITSPAKNVTISQPELINYTQHTLESVEV
jgi:hypothetical protein